MRQLRMILSRSYPAKAWLGVLISVFIIEYLIMLALPRLLPAHHGSLITSIVDAAVLTAIIAPILWWFVERPLYALLDLRTRHLADLFNSIEKERRRVAMELHDGVGQSLTMLVSGLRTAAETSDLPEIVRRCRELQQVSQEALSEVKRVTMGLRPSLLDDLGLVPAVIRLSEDMSLHYGVDFSVSAPGLEGKRLPPSIETAAFRIIQEALNNIVKHSGAHTGSVRIALQDGRLVASVEDDGCGLAPAILGRWDVTAGRVGITDIRERPAWLSSQQTFGLIGMRERARMLGGQLTIQSEPQHGTRVVATIPIGAGHGEQDPDHAR